MPHFNVPVPVFKGNFNEAGVAPVLGDVGMGDIYPVGDFFATRSGITRLPGCADEGSGHRVTAFHGQGTGYTQYQFRVFSACRRHGFYGHVTLGEGTYAIENDGVDVHQFPHGVTVSDQHPASGTFFNAEPHGQRRGQCQRHRGHTRQYCQCSGEGFVDVTADKPPEQKINGGKP